MLEANNVIIDFMLKIKENGLSLESYIQLFVAMYNCITVSRNNLVEYSMTLEIDSF